MRIPVIFEIEGEAGFRKRETQVLFELSQERNLVVATGGGVVLVPQNRRCMRDTGFVVYLSAQPSVLFDRTRLDRNRPLLQVDDPLAKLTELFQQRDPLYREVADIVVEGKDTGAIALVQEIEKELQTRCEP